MEELKDLMTKDCELLETSNPEPVLSAMGLLGGKGCQIKNNRIWFRDVGREGERTPSANFNLTNQGKWLFYDFGNPGKGENIITFVKNRLGMDFKDSLSFIFDSMGLRSSFLEEVEKEKQIKENEKREEKLKRENARKEKIEKLKEAVKINIGKNRKIASSSEHYVCYISNTCKKQDLRNFLLSRKLDPDDMPNGIFFIKGITLGKNKDGTDREYKTSGVGVLTGDEKEIQKIERGIKEKNFYYYDDEKGRDYCDTLGADIHFPPIVFKNGRKLKSRIFGASGISDIKPLNISGDDRLEVAIFESKMDYYAATMQIDLSSFRVIISNSIEYYQNIIDRLDKTEKKIDRLIIFNQNDTQKGENKISPSELFTYTILQGIKGTENKYVIKYEKEEEGMDINDLLIKNVEIYKRIDNANSFKPKKEVVEAYKKRMENKKIGSGTEKPEQKKEVAKDNKNKNTDSTPSTEKISVDIVKATETDKKKGEVKNGIYTKRHQ